MQEWLNFITSEIHKSFTPLFKPNTPDAYKPIAKENLANRYTYIDKQLAGRQYLMGDDFTVADAYLFTVLRWSSLHQIDLAQYRNCGVHNPRRRAPEGASGDAGGRVGEGCGLDGGACLNLSPRTGRG